LVKFIESCYAPFLQGPLRVLLVWELEFLEYYLSWFLAYVLG